MGWTGGPAIYSALRGKFLLVGDRPFRSSGLPAQALLIGRVRLGKSEPQQRSKACGTRRTLRRDITTRGRPLTDALCSALVRRFAPRCRTGVDAAIHLPGADVVNLLTALFTSSPLPLDSIESTW